MAITADELVNREVLCCVSGLFWSMIQHSDTTELLFGTTQDEISEWCSVPDLEEAMHNYLQDLDFSELCTLCDEVGYASDALADTCNPDYIDDFIEAHPHLQDKVEAQMRSYIMDHSTDDERQEIMDEADFDWHDFDRDVFEHWVITPWLGRRLEARGERVFDFEGLTVWGRCTTGQAISIDYVVEQITKEVTT